MFAKAGKWILIILVLIQLIPYGRQHTNPPVTKEPAWDSNATRALFVNACYDCHSNQTIWRWYSHVAPASWLVQNDVDGGRRHLNFSEWDRAQRHAGDVATQVNRGDMPPWFYLPLHPSARLTAAEKQVLIAGAEKSLGPQKTEAER